MTDVGVSIHRIEDLPPDHLPPIHLEVEDRRDMRERVYTVSAAHHEPFEFHVSGQIVMTTPPELLLRAVQDQVRRYIAALPRGCAEGRM